MIFRLKINGKQQAVTLNPGDEIKILAEGECQIKRINA